MDEKIEREVEERLARPTHAWEPALTPDRARAWFDDLCRRLLEGIDHLETSPERDGAVDRRTTDGDESS